MSDLIKQATHRCKTCGALWAYHAPERNYQTIASWSLKSDSCGECCDNKEMGEQIETLGEYAVRIEARCKELEEEKEFMISKVGVDYDGLYFGRKSEDKKLSQKWLTHHVQHKNSSPHEINKSMIEILKQQD